jgi:hypothetical protein
MNASAYGSKNAMNLSSLRNALEEVKTGRRLATKKTLKKRNRVGLKKRKHTTAKNRVIAAEQERRRRRQQRLAAKRIKVFETKAHGIEGIEELIEKLKQLKRMYNAANVGKQSDMSVYISMLTTAIQDVMEKDFKEVYVDSYPELFDETFASEEPVEYISSLKNFLEDLVEEYEETANEDKQIQLDIAAEAILEVAIEIGEQFEKMGESKKNNSVDALADLFGSFGI